MATKWSRACTCLVSVLLFTSLWAADFWEQKNYLDWSEKECNRLLTRSPWAASNSFRRTSNLGSSETVERETTEIIYFRMLTAKPVRMALGRLQLLERPGDEALRKQVEDLVEGPVGDKVLIQISYTAVPGATPQLQALHSFFGRATKTSFHGNTVLVSSDRTTIGVEDYLPWGPSRTNPVLVFPRLNESGEPYFTGQESSITLRSDFEVESVEGRREYRIHIKMKPKDMMFQGEFAF